MKLEDQVAPLALAQRMKELGFPQDTCFVWARREMEPDEQAQLLEVDEYKWALVDDLCVQVAAPTVAEMLAWLPDEWSIFQCGRDNGLVNPWTVENFTETAWVQGQSAAHALALAMVDGVGEGQRIERVTPPRTVPDNVKDVKSAGPSGGAPRG